METEPHKPTLWLTKRGLINKKNGELQKEATNTHVQCGCPKVEHLNAKVLRNLLTFTLNDYVKGHRLEAVQNLSKYKSL